jgi:DNA polymerase-4
MVGAAMKVILHVDMDAFFAAVEQHDHPAYRGRPVIVGAAPDQRGVVAAASYEARRFGVHSAMSSREAARRCPQAVFLPVNGPRYRDVSRQVFGIMERFTPLVEPLSIDEAFLDVTGARRFYGEGRDMALRIKEAIHRETGLTASVGVASNKFLAKLASDMDKPDGLTEVPVQRSEVLAFLAPLPVERIWGVGKVTQEELGQHGIRTIGELQAVPERQLAAIIGRHAARHLRRLAYGEDARDIEVEREEKSLSREHTFSQDCRSRAVVERTLLELVDDVGIRLRAAGRYAAVVHLKLRWKGFKTITRQCPLPTPSCDDFTLRDAARVLLGREAITKPVRLVGFGVSRLTDTPGAQLSLFETGEAASRREQLSRAVDGIRDRYGERSIGRAGSRDKVFE